MRELQPAIVSWLNDRDQREPVRFPSFREAQIWASTWNRNHPMLPAIAIAEVASETDADPRRV